MTWQKHVKNMTADEVVSASKALDYLDGYQEQHIIDLLNDTSRGITNWKKRGIYPVIDNLTAKVITRSALTYQKEPERNIKIGDTVSEIETDKYHQLLGYNGMVAINASDVVARLLKACMLLAQYIPETKKLVFSVLHRGNSDVVYNPVTQEVESLFYTAGGVSPSGGQMYHHWTKDKITDIDVKGQSLRVLGSEDNPYKMIPVAVRYDIAPPRVGFWHKPQWQELIRLNEVINMFHTEVRHGSQMQNFPPLFTNAKLPDGIIVGADSIVEMDSLSDNVYVEYKTPQINLDKFREWLKDLQETVADNWGVNLNFGGGGSADSGFKLIVEETWNLETRKQRQKPAKVMEEQLYDVIKTISDAHSLGLADGAIKVDFADPALAVDTISERQEDRADVASGIESREGVWRKENPDITPEQIEAKKQEIDGLKLPDFTDVTGS